MSRRRRPLGEEVATGEVIRERAVSRRGNKLAQVHVCPVLGDVDSVDDLLCPSLALAALVGLFNNNGMLFRLDSQRGSMNTAHT